MSCAHCDGLSAAELATAMKQLVYAKTIFEGPYCHCNDVDGLRQAGSLVGKKTYPLRPPSAGRPSERSTP